MTIDCRLNNFCVAVDALGRPAEAFGNQENPCVFTQKRDHGSLFTKMIGQFPLSWGPLMLASQFTDGFDESFGALWHDFK